jgi:hypothetical protein
MSLPIQKSAAKNFADSEIDSQKFVAANSKIGRKTMSLPIQKSTA